jgi:hypothetical protein
MTPEQIIDKIERRIGQSVSFPKKQGDKDGFLKDRVVVPSWVETDARYFSVVDLIQWQDEREDALRFGYYEFDDQLHWVNRPLTDAVSRWKKFLVKAAKEKPWFRNLLQEVMAEL